MKDQILKFQQKLAEKESLYIKLDNELKNKRRECEKLKKMLES